jgi:hypothetical protein
VQGARSHDVLLDWDRKQPDAEPVFSVYTDPKEPTSSVSLIDSPPGCLVIRRFVEYGWKDPGAAGAARPARR